MKNKTLLILILSYTIAGCIGQANIATTEFEDLKTPTNNVNSEEQFAIGSIQGNGHTSPFARKEIMNLSGIVTVKRADGFYMQSILPDDIPETSEGIFVFLGFPPKVKIGDHVLVDGIVTEFIPGEIEDGNLSITEIEKPNIRVVSSNNLLPDPIIIGEGGAMTPTEIIDDDQNKIFELEDGLDFFESLEGMLVQINNGVVVAPTNSYKEIVVLPDFGKWATNLNSRGGITLSMGDFNPERIIIDDSLASLPETNVGDFFVDPLIGVVDYSFGNYKVQLLKKPKNSEGNLQPATVGAAGENELLIATYNVENLSASDSQDRFILLADQIVNILQAPDLIALQEIQDNSGEFDDGIVDASETYRKIINAIIDIDGPEYFFIDLPPEDNQDGGAPGSNIRVGYLYRTDRGLSFIPKRENLENYSARIINFQGNPSLEINPSKLEPENYAFVDSRKPLVAEFLYNGNNIIVFNVHFNSKGGDTPLFGITQPPRLPSEVQRKNQAGVIASFVEEIISGEQEAKIIVLGDLNDFYFSPSAKILENSGLVNLIVNLPETERYTYNYEGNSQNLDNFFVSSSLLALNPQVEIAHINSEFYHRTRLSDHDPIVALFYMEP
jgi:predicted extracellular nuclease